MSPAGLNAFQVDQVNREINSRTSTYTQLFPRKLVATCNAGVQYSGCDCTRHTQYTHNYCQKPKKCLNKNTKRHGDNFGTVACQSYMCVAHTQLQTSRNDIQ